MKSCENARCELDYWEKVYPIRTGWTDDEKYKVCDADGRTFFLRKAVLGRYADLKGEAQLIRMLRKKGMPVAKVEEVDTCPEADKCYLLLEWIDGITLDNALPLMTEQDQYESGIKAGRQLRELHRIPPEIEAFPHRNLKKKKMNELNAYLDSSVRIEGDETIVKHIKDNIDIIGNGPAVIEHSDYHPGNMILRPDMSLAIIDFNGSHLGDAYEEFYKLELFVIRLSRPYCLGQIHGYFNGDPPKDFWHAHSVYTAHAALYGFKWAEDHGKKGAWEEERRRLRRILKDYDHFRRIIPAWYILFEDYRKPNDE